MASLKLATRYILLRVVLRYNWNADNTDSADLHGFFFILIHSPKHKQNQKKSVQIRPIRVIRVPLATRYILLRVVLRYNWNTDWADLHGFFFILIHSPKHKQNQKKSVQIRPIRVIRVPLATRYILLRVVLRYNWNTDWADLHGFFFILIHSPKHKQNQKKSVQIRPIRVIRVPIVSQNYPKQSI